MSKGAAPDYFNRVNPSLSALIPASAKTVLEIGCGAGALGKAFKERSPQCRYVGVEHSPDAASRALSVLDRVITGDIESLDLDQLGLPEKRVDCMIFGDVLEHLRDPWQCLSRLLPLLAPDGVVLACIPNVQHWSVLLGLMRGQWRYSHEGLLDITHLRFFTLEGVKEMFAASGLHVVDIRGRKSYSGDPEAFFMAMRPALDALKIDYHAFEVQSGAIQYVVRATAKPPRSILIQARTLKPVGGCNEVRINQPAIALGTIPGVHVQQKEMSAALIRSPISDRVLILQRPILSPADLNGLEAFRKAGYVLISEFDDHPLRWPSIAQHGHLSFKAVHAVQTSTPALASFLGQFNPEVAVFPNALARISPFRERRSGNSPTVFFGALNREEDWGPLIPSINRIAARFPAVRFLVVHDRNFFDALETSNKHFTETAAYSNYLDRLDEADIALLPLSDTPFNRMKSDLKFIECAAASVSVIASSIVYESAIRHGETGMLYSSVEGFEAAFSGLIVDQTMRRQMAESAYFEVRRNRMLSAQVDRRLDWYRLLIEKRDVLEEKLTNRLSLSTS